MLKNKSKSCLVVALIAAISLTACHPHVTPTSDMDKQLSCSELQAEIARTQDTKKKIEKARGFSLRNVGLALFFWPGIFINEITGQDAAAEANTKLVALQNIYAKKQCTKEDCADLAKAETKVDQAA